MLEEIYVLGGFEVFKVMCQYPVQSLGYLLVNQDIHSWLLLPSQACPLLPSQACLLLTILLAVTVVMVYCCEETPSTMITLIKKNL